MLNKPDCNGNTFETTATLIVLSFAADETDSSYLERQKLFEKDCNGKQD
ncbi:hypothetical protein [Pedobacter aquatilis]|nr:hypothetical protein [Pedobacter aquatilis]